MTKKTATLYRLHTHDHICPFGIRSKDLLEREGFEVDDHLLRTKDEAEQIKKKFDVKTTPQTVIDGRRIGGYDDLLAHFNRPPAKKKKSYTPVVMIFGLAFFMSAALQLRGTFLVSPFIHDFVAIAMCLLAAQKLRDLFAFGNMFLNYDLVAQKLIPYSTLYAFCEAIAGVGMLSGRWPLGFATLSFAIGLEGSVSVIKAVYIEKRDIKCACMGGDSNVPLGAVSLLENLGMVGMGLWIVIQVLSGV